MGCLHLLFGALGRGDLMLPLGAWDTAQTAACSVQV